jgi:hypothetical protein
MLTNKHKLSTYSRLQESHLILLFLHKMQTATSGINNTAFIHPYLAFKSHTNTRANGYANTDPLHPEFTAPTAQKIVHTETQNQKSCLGEVSHCQNKTSLVTSNPKNLCVKWTR